MPRRICQYIVKPAELIDNSDIPDNVYRRYDWMLARAWEETYTEYSYLTYSNAELASAWKIEERTARDILAQMRTLGLIDTEQDGRTKRRIYLKVVWGRRGSDSERKTNAPAPIAKRVEAHVVSAKAQQYDYERDETRDERDEFEGGTPSAMLVSHPNSTSNSFKELNNNSSTDYDDNDDSDFMNGNCVWHSALGELQLQMTRATFDQWVRGTFAKSFDGKMLIVGTPSSYAKEWLENRLNTTIQRTVTGIVGKSVQIKYVVADQREKVR